MAKRIKEKYEYGQEEIDKCTREAARDEEEIKRMNIYKIIYNDDKENCYNEVRKMINEKYSNICY